MRNKFAKFAALAVCAGFANCSEYDAGIDPIPEKSVYETVYESAFIQTFGQPAANQDWGFGSKATRGSNMNANMWNQDWDCPSTVDLTDEELAELKALLSPGKETYNTDIFPYENYWVQQVYTGQAPDEAYDVYNRLGNVVSEGVVGSGQMNYLNARNEREEQRWTAENGYSGAWETVEYEHINNFNSGSNNNTPGTCGCGVTHVGTTLVVDMSLEGVTPTNQFGFEDSYGTEHVYNNYLIVYYKGYWYVGFDFEMNKPNANDSEGSIVERDWNFTDWIVRITPAYAKGATPEFPEIPGGNGGDDTFPQIYWVIAEDLTIQTSTDFDFNDIVYEVKITDAETAQVTILAAGGTLPIYIIDHNGTPHEAHYALGASTTKVPINVGTGVTGTAQPIEIKGTFTGEPSDANSIVVKVDKDGELIELTAKEGEVASKIRVEVDFDWCDEREPIYEKYPKFNDWVKDPKVDWTNIGE